MNTRIKAVRKEAGLNQSQFAESLGLSRSMIARVEIGTEIFSDRSLRELCRVYNINEEWLRTGEGDMYRPMSRNDHLAAFINEVMESEPEDIRRVVIESLSALSSDEWTLIAKMTDMLVEKRKRAD